MAYSSRPTSALPSAICDVECADARLLLYRSMFQAFRKKSGAPKLPDLSASARSIPAEGLRPGNAGIDLRPDGERIDIERIHDSAGCLAACNDEACEAKLRKRSRDLRKRVLDDLARIHAAELASGPPAPRRASPSSRSGPGRSPAVAEPVQSRLCIHGRRMRGPCGSSRNAGTPARWRSRPAARWRRAGSREDDLASCGSVEAAADASAVGAPLR